MVFLPEPDKRDFTSFRPVSLTSLLHKAIVGGKFKDALDVVH